MSAYPPAYLLHRTRIGGDLLVNGSTAHSVRPWFGENAITKARAWPAELHNREPELVDIDGLEYRE